MDYIEVAVCLTLCAFAAILPYFLLFSLVALGIAYLTVWLYRKGIKRD